LISPRGSSQLITGSAYCAMLAVKMTSSYHWLACV